MCRPAPLAVALGVALAVVTASAGCGGDTSAADDDRLRAVTTVSPITNIVAMIGGEHVDVVGVVPEGTNSHTFEPPPSVAEALVEADVVYLNGLQLEEPTRRLAEDTVGDDVELVTLGEQTITPDEYVYDFSFPREGGKPNPHLWTHPGLALRYAEIIRSDLAERDPDHADDFTANYEAFEGRVESFDAALRTALDTVPPADRRLLTYHDSFAYFARDYGWQVIGAIQPADFEEPTAREVADLIDQVRDAGVPAIFGSEVFPSPVLEQIGQETGARYVDELRDDDLPGEPGDPEHSLLGLLRYDYATIVSALGGDPSALEGVDVGNVVDDTAEYPQ
ncbi:MAG: metal ABC transporter substrate-binding protein [Acidimicrobiales bacterium]